jgi:hypothetical protein
VTGATPSSLLRRQATSYRVRLARTATAAAAVALFLPSTAWAHSRAPTVAIDYRFHLDPSPPGVHVSILDGDRALRVTVASGTSLLVRGYLQEPELRFDRAGVSVNASSPTATADRLVPSGKHGWVRLGGGRSLAWHEHRLAPAGPRGRFRILIVLNGRPAVIAGTFIRVPRPVLWPWLGVATAFLAAIAAASRRRRPRAPLGVLLGVLSGLAALATVIGFALRDQTKGGIDWLTIDVALIVALLLATLLVRATGHGRAQVAGVTGVVAAAAMITAVPIFWHGLVVSALPATSARLACAFALLAGGSAAVISLLLENGDEQDEDDPRLEVKAPGEPIRTSFDPPQSGLVEGAHTDAERRRQRATRPIRQSLRRRRARKSTRLPTGLRLRERFSRR